MADVLKWNQLDSVGNIGSESSNFIQLPTETQWNELHIEIYVVNMSTIYTLRLINNDSNGYYRTGYSTGSPNAVSTSMVVVGLFNNKIYLESLTINGVDYSSSTTVHCWYR